MTQLRQITYNFAKPVKASTSFVNLWFLEIFSTWWLRDVFRWLFRENNIDFMSFRFWIGIWVMVALLVIVAFDLSALVRYITRFTEESFACLISLIFIYEAFVKIFEIWHEDPVYTGTTRENKTAPWLYQCFCEPQEQEAVGNNSLQGSLSSYSS